MHTALLALALAMATALGCGRIGYEPGAVEPGGEDAAGSAERAALSRGVLCRTELKPGRFATLFVVVNGARTEEVVVPIGAQNRFSPPPEDRGQPERYPPGRTLVLVVHEESTLVWFLAGGTSTSSARAPACRIVEQDGGPAVDAGGGRLVPLPTS